MKSLEVNVTLFDPAGWNHMSKRRILLKNNWPKIGDSLEAHARDTQHNQYFYRESLNK
jgi:hypothetical protein